MVASARLMVAPNIPVRKTSIGSIRGWQTDAWEFYDEVGPFRFGINWLANAMSRVNLLAAIPPTVPGADPTPINAEDKDLTAVQKRTIELVAMIADGPAGQGQLLASMATHLSVPGICWLVIEPSIDSVVGTPEYDTYALWTVFGTEEIRASTTSGYDFDVRVEENEWRPVHLNGIVLKIWRKHPRRSWEPDSSARAALPDLREISLLMAHTIASGQSRLAGAGVLVVPSEAVFPPGQRAQTSESVDPDDENTTAPEDEFVEVLIEAMTTPLTDRGTASAVVPLVMKVPGEWIEKIRHIKFSTDFDGRTTELLKAAIERLAIDLDFPPEVLTGTSGMNHWGAWQVAEEAITLHIEPLAEMGVHGLSIGFLRVVLAAEHFSIEEINSVMVWFGTADLTASPDKSKEATEAYDRFDISTEAYLREIGMSSDDIPEDAEKHERVLLQIALAYPALTSAILMKLGYIQEPLLADSNAGTSNPNDGAPPPKKKGGEKGPPAENSLTLHPIDPALVEACNGVVFRALERSGARLKSAMGKKTTGGAASIDWADVSTIHTGFTASDFATIDSLLFGAWDHVPAIAGRYDVEPTALTVILDTYTRGLLATKQEHRLGRLAVALGST